MRLQGRPAPRRLERRATTHLNKAGQVLAFSVERHRHRHPRGQAAHHLRGLPAGRRHHQPQVRRHGPGPLHQPRDHPPAGRRAAASTASPARAATFTLYLPLNFSPRPGAAAARACAPPIAAPHALPSACRTSRSRRWSTTATRSSRGDPVVLIVEDDPRFASILLSPGRARPASRAWSPARARRSPSLARRFGPDAIMLDIGLPDMDGLALLDLLKRTPETRHIPVHVISADDQKRPRPVDGRLRLHPQAGGARGGGLHPRRA